MSRGSKKQIGNVFIDYHYHGYLNVYYNNKRIRIFPYINGSDKTTADKWIESFNNNIIKPHSVY
jgi:hypothetical protein